MLIYLDAWLYDSSETKLNLINYILYMWLSTVCIVIFALW